MRAIVERADSSVGRAGAVNADPDIMVEGEGLK